MNKLNVKKQVGLIVGIVCFNIVIFSPGLIGLQIKGGSALQSATGVTLLFISFIVLLYGSYVLLFKPSAVTPVKNIQTHEEYITALNHYSHVKALDKDVLQALDQLDRIEKKKIALLDVLSQRFDKAELSYKKFNSVIYEVEKLLYLNIRGILNKLSVFNASDYSAVTSEQSSKRLSSKLIEERKALYEEYFAYVSGYLVANEEILLKLDKLLLEISLLGSSDYRDVEEMPCMQEIDILIKQTKYYK